MFVDSGEKSLVTQELYRLLFGQMRNFFNVIVNWILAKFA